MEREMAGNGGIGYRTSTASLVTDEQYRLLAENANDFVMRVGTDLVVEWVSPSVTNVIGWLPEEIVGKTPWDFSHPDDVARAQATADRARHGHSDADRRQVRCKDGSYRWLARTVRPVLDHGAVVTIVSGFRDIQAEVEAEQRLAESEARYRLLAENATDIVAELSPDDRVTWISPSVSEVLGWDPSFLLGKRGGAIVHPDDLPAVVEARDHFMEGAASVPAFRCQRADGTYLWMSGVSRAILDDEGNLTSRVVGLRDISALVIAQERLAASEEAYRAMAENTTEVVARTDLTGFIRWISPSVTALLGWEPDSMIGRAAIEFVHQDDRTIASAVHKRVNSGGIDEAELRLRQVGGGFRWVSASVRPLRDETGEVVGRTSGWRDIQAEHEAREALQDSEYQYRMLAEKGSDVIVLTRPDRHVAWVSPAVTRVLGWTPGELLGTVMSDLVHPDDHPQTQDDRVSLYADTPGQGDEIPFLIRMRGKDGTYRWMTGTSTRVVDDNSRLVGVVAGMRDVDELVRTREEAQRSWARLRATVDSLLDPHVLLAAVRDDGGHIVDFVYEDANDAACAYHQLSHDELVGARLLDILPGHSGTGLLKLYARAIETGLPLVLDDFPYRNEILGEERHYDIRGLRVGDALSYTWRDVTDRHAAMEALAASEEEYRLLAQNSSDVVLRERTGHVLWVSPSLIEMLGWTPDEWIGCRVDDFVHPADLDRLRTARNAVQEGESRSGRLRIRARGGSFHWVEVRANAYRKANGVLDGIVVSLHTVDAEVAAEQELKLRAERDPLTGILNRTEAIDQLAAKLGHSPRTGHHLAVMFCDLDTFKAVNDTFGHAVGDEFLRVIAERIEDSVRSSDLVARMGGDEILVVLDRVHDLAEAVAIAEKIRRTVASPVTVAGATTSSTVSIGVTMADYGDTVDVIIARADDAMYQAKNAGRDRVVTAGDRV